MSLIDLKGGLGFFIGLITFCNFSPVTIYTFVFCLGIFKSSPVVSTEIICLGLRTPGMGATSVLILNCLLVKSVFILPSLFISVFDLLSSFIYLSCVLSGFSFAHAILF